ncbi:MAG: ABC transporter ATP-binding protein [Alphaproteobacteria bacterium]|nr:ABC transporter ATP-binding protein [Alphaproteobacteria bacterium]
MQLISNESKQIIHDLKEALCIATKGHKKMFGLTVILWVFRGIIKVLCPIVASIVVTKIQGNFDEKTLAGVLIFWLVVNAFLGRFLDFLDYVFWDWMEPLRLFCHNYLFKQNFKNLLNIPPIVLENQQSAKIVSTINSLNQTMSYIIMHSLRILTWVVAWLGAVLILLKEKPSFALLTFVCWLASYFSNSKIVKRFSKVDELEKMRIDNDAEKTDHIDNMVNINSLQIQDEVVTDIGQKLDDYAWFSFRANMKEDAARILLLFWDVLPLIISSLVAATTAIQTKDIGHFILLTGLVATMVNTGAPILFFSGTIIKSVKTYRKLTNEMKYDHSLDLKLGKEKLPEGGIVEIKNVSFTYPESKDPVLEGLSLKIKQGDRVAIIGNSGMGKSTLINVMQHAYEVQKGQVLINGKNVQNISLKSLKQNITYINQHPIFWRHKTIRENLLMFNPKATEVEIYRALQSANLLKELTKKEKGIDSKATALSAGQKQRLALARAFLRQTPIIIMDEPTANLDTYSQSKVLLAIKNLSKVKGHKPTVIFASNVPAEIASANRILLLENGQIVEDGNPKKLMANCKTKVYNRLKRYKSLFEDTK